MQDHHVQSREVASGPATAVAVARTWPAALTLFILAPVVAELVSSSTPLLMFINPIIFIYMTALYGGGALLIREVVRRRGLGWRSVVILGAAYGVVEEGLVITSWFNPYWLDVVAMEGYSRWLDMNWLWSVHLTAYHAIISITGPILIVELLFPRVAGRVWLSRRARRLVLGWFLFACVLGLVVFGFVAFRKAGYLHPPATYLLAVVCTVALIMWGLRAGPATVVISPKAPPRRWLLRLAGFGLTIGSFLLSWTAHSWLPTPLAAVLLMTGLLALAWLAVRRWSARMGWGDPHRLALFVGALWFLLLFAPLVEFGAAPSNGEPVAGQTLVALTAFVALLMLERRVRRRAPLPSLPLRPLSADRSCLDHSP